MPIYQNVNKYKQKKKSGVWAAHSESVCIRLIIRSIMETAVPKLRRSFPLKPNLYSDKSMNINLQHVDQHFLVHDSGRCKQIPINVRA